MTVQVNKRGGCSVSTFHRREVAGGCGDNVAHRRGIPVLLRVGDGFPTYAFGRVLFRRGVEKSSELSKRLVACEQNQGVNLLRAGVNPFFSIDLFQSVSGFPIKAGGAGSSARMTSMEIQTMQFETDHHRPTGGNSFFAACLAVLSRFSSGIDIQPTAGSGKKRLPRSRFEQTTHEGPTFFSGPSHGKNTGHSIKA